MMRLYWLVGLGLLVCGCGLADYEQKMIDTQTRQQRWEEENRVLGGELRVPAPVNAKGKRVALADLFLRPPVGILTNPTDENNPRAGVLYSYSPPKGKLAGPFAMVELAFGDLKDKDFIVELIKKGWGVVNHPAPAQRQVQQQNRPGPPPPPPRVFLSTEFEDNQYFYSVNVWRGPKQQVAVVYWVLRAQKEASKRAIQLSLESFLGDGERVNRMGPLDVVPGPPLGALPG
jgi:hypothetical protein